MSSSDKFDKIAKIIICFALVTSIALMYLVGNGIIVAKERTTYETLLFDSDRVHTIDIEMEDWDSFIETCENEEYALCNVTIDGTTINNVGLRAKGNTSLSTVSSMNSDRYSFKIEFDHYDSGITYYGLDKLCLNNIIQDNTYMKDYITYTLMNEMGVASPLCSYSYITINGEDWGLYLAVEAIEDSFIQRNYDSLDGELYKPDSISMGGGRGNGKGFDMEDFDFSDTKDIQSEENQKDFNFPSDNNGGFNFPSGESMGEFNVPEGFNSENSNISDFNFSNIGGGTFSSNDVKLQYIDDNISSYSNIFNNSKTDVTTKDKNRLISSLKTLSEYVDGKVVDIESVVDVDSVIKYFVVHNYVCNGDSYTGTMIHNYYLYEEDGQMSMIPWDYNLAFGGFQGGSATSEVNSDIYNPSSNSLESLPMLAWIFEEEKYTEIYEEYYKEFLKIDINALIEKTYTMIAQYVKKDPTAFCTYDEFVKAKETLQEFCKLRSQAITNQLNDITTQVDASSINLSDMGSMNNTITNKNMQGGFNNQDNDPNKRRGN